MSKLKMYWWKEQPNFGDALNPIIIERLFNIPVLWSELKDADIVGAGSCLQWVAKENIDHPHEIHVWGTGYMFDEEPAVSSQLVKHYAVRGKKSKAYGNLRGVALGDPGILSPLLLATPVTKAYRVGIVPHLWNIDDQEITNARIEYPDAKIIDVRMPALAVVEQIASCDFIYSSSLHGLIVADSFNIPNQWVSFSKKLFGGPWKFEDYYSVYDIDTPSMINFKSRMLDEQYIDVLLGRFQQRNNIKDLQRNLLDSFPPSLMS